MEKFYDVMDIVDGKAVLKERKAMTPRKAAELRVQGRLMVEPSWQGGKEAPRRYESPWTLPRKGGWR